MEFLKKTAFKLVPIVNSLWYTVLLTIVMVSQLMWRNPWLIGLAMTLVFVFFTVQLLTQELTKRQRTLYIIILGLNVATVLMVALAAIFG